MSNPPLTPDPESARSTRPPTAPWIGPGHTFRSVTEQISAIVLTGRTPRGWYISFAVAVTLLSVLLVSVYYLFAKGVGIWGINVPVAWGFAIVNFVWWIGIGHAGTLISAILLLLHQHWRTSINRFAEAMTLFAVACAGLFPILHLGRPWLFYWLIPYPATTGVWPQFRSPLVWDFFAVSTYATVSLLFWYIGLIPDLATLRDRARHRLARIGYGVLAMGWRGSARHWRRYQDAYLLLAGLATPLVVSVHTIVSFDFAVGLVPGWHATIFPPYFVAGAIYSGFAMVLTIAIPLRAAYRLHDFVTDRHLNNMAKIMLVSGLIVAYGYLVEAFMALYSGSIYERALVLNRVFGPYAAYYWLLIAANVLIPQALWFRRVRANVIALWALSLIINVGMWLERFIIVVVSLSRDFLPSAWRMYSPTIWDWSTYLGTIGLFATLLLLFIRFLPMISIAEMRELLEETTGHRAIPERRPEDAEEVEYSAEIRRYGILAEFHRPEELVNAAKAAHAAGYRRFDGYSPYPVEGLADAIGFRRTRMSLVALIGGLVGCVGGYALAYYCSVIAYPVNIGGRPLNSWQAYIPVTFETTILAASLAAVLGMLALNGLPRPHHPLFNVPRFEAATQDSFFLCIFASDPKFDVQETRRFLTSLNGVGVHDVPG